MNILQHGKNFLRVRTSGKNHLSAAYPTSQGIRRTVMGFESIPSTWGTLGNAENGQLHTGVRK